MNSDDEDVTSKNNTNLSKKSSLNIKDKDLQGMNSDF